MDRWFIGWLVDACPSGTGQVGFDGTEAVAGLRFGLVAQMVGCLVARSVDCLAARSVDC